jgi:hypothetical protein
MPIYRSVLASALALAAAFPVVAQQINAGQCIVAGRLDAKEKWAPRFQGIELLAPRGRVISASGKQAIADAQQVRLTKPALLSRCEGDRDIARADDAAPIPKEPVPAVAPGIVEVESVAFPKLRSGGELVELRVKVPLDRVVMVKR